MPEMLRKQQDQQRTSFSAIRSWLLAGTIMLNLFVVGLLATSLLGGYHHAVLAAETMTHNLAGSVAQSVDSMIRKIDLTVGAIVDELQQPKLQKAFIDRHLVRQMERIPEMASLLVTDKNGVVISGAVRMNGIVQWPDSQSIADQEHFIRLKNGTDVGAVISRPFMGKVQDRWLVAIAQRYNLQDGSFAGIVTGSIRIDHFSETFSRVSTGTGGAISLINSDPSIVARYPESGAPGSDIGFRITRPSVVDFIRSGTSSAAFTVVSGVDRVKRTFSLQKLSVHPLFIFVGVSTDEYLAPWRKQAALSVLIAGVFLLCTFSFVWFFLRALRQRESDLAALRESEDRYRSLFEAESDAIVVIDAETFSNIDANQAAVDLYGYSKDELLALKAPDLSAEPDETGRRIQTDDGLVRIPLRYHQKKDGTVFPVEIMARFFQLNQRRVLLAAMRDITEQRDAERAVQDSRDFLDRIINSIGDPVFVKDRQHRFVLTNRALGELLNLDSADMIGKTDTDYFPPDQVKVFWEKDNEVFASGQEQVNEEQITDAQGTVRTILTKKNRYRDTSGREFIVGIIRDLTEIRKAENERQHIERQMLHAQKLESLGVLAGGIAHDFNNILTAVIGNAELALKREVPGSSSASNLRQIIAAASKAAELARQMLAYAGRGIFVREPFDLSTLVRDMTGMLEISISKKAALQYRLANDLPAIEGDVTQVHQIVMNLVINASEAIGDAPGVITVTTGCMACKKEDFAHAWGAENLRDGDYVFLEISDTGCGMHQETISRIFDPFFTTKFTGRGLGMSAVLGIVKSHGGAVKIASEPGKGTTFLILFPVSSKSKPAIVCHDDLHAWRGHGTVLLVDDEESVRMVGSQMLKMLGFDVVTAENGEEALRCYRELENVVCVILDRTMPLMGGEETFEALKQIDPQVRIIMSSGYNESEVTETLVGRGLAGYIQKPYDLKSLLKALQSITS